MQEILLKVRYFERGLSKTLKKCDFFRTQSLSVDKIFKNIKALELATSRSSGYETSSEKFLYYLCIIWPSLMMQYEAVFELFQNYTCKFMQANSWHHKLFYFHLSFWIWKVWKGRSKSTKIWISRERKVLFRWNNFLSFLRAIIWWKNKNLIKSSGHKL